MRFEAGLYEHAARLIDCTPAQASRDGELLFEAHKLYQHTPVVAGIDLYNLEAELLGAQVALPAGNASPSIIAPPFRSPAHIEERLRKQHFVGGSVEMVLGAAEKLATSFPDAQVRVPVMSPAEIRAEVRRVFGALKDSGPFIFAGSHMFQDDCDLEAIEAAYDEAYKLAAF